VKLDPRQQPWMTAPEALAVIAALGSDNARFVGGSVRNALMGRPVDEVDIATPIPPEQVTRLLEAAGIKAVPTGIEHGTITAVANGKPYEITTLRRDVETDGRHAVVAFSEDWVEDAKRRDFTMNALYASIDGEVFDYVNSLEDLKAGRVRFVGDAAMRIREDYLRILRLFRFHAWYGKGDIDQEALHASAAEKAGLASLSGERIQKEVLRLLEADNPIPGLRAMAAAGIVSEILPGTLLLPRLERLVGIDADNFFAPDPLLRLAALLPDAEAAEEVAERFRLSNAQSARLADLVSAREKIVSYLSVKEVRKLLYLLGPERFKDRVLFKWADDPKISNAMQWLALLAHANSWQRPRFPLTGEHVMAAGVPEGPLIGRILSEVEEWWIDSDFIDDKFSLAERLKAVVQGIAY
jgi:poly(A) polymerase